MSDIKIIEQLELKDGQTIREVAAGVDKSYEVTRRALNRLNQEHWIFCVYGKPLKFSSWRGLGPNKTKSNRHE